MVPPAEPVEPTEVELKLAFDPPDAARLSAWASIGSSARVVECQTSTYFDTPEQDLRKAGFALRIREAGGRRVQTVKSDGGDEAGLFVRSEWERPVRSDVPVFDEKSGPLGKLLPQEMLSRVAPAFVTEVERETHRANLEDAEIVYDIDRGTIRADGRAEPAAELELELKSGAPAALFELARDVDEQVPLRLSVLSKAERGYRLLEGAPPAWKAEAPAVRPGMGPAEAFRVIAATCLRQFRLNEDLLMTTASVESLHQARVGLRRLRSAFSLFGRLLPLDERATALRGELRWLASELGEVRNLDVLIPQVRKKDRFRLVEHRSHRFALLAERLGSRRTRLLMLNLAEWMALGLEEAEQPSEGWAANLLDRRLKRLRKEGRGLASQTDEERHEVRIEAKKLRYGAEFLGGLFPDQKAQRRHARFMKRLAKLQDQLGELNDLQTAPEVLAGLGFPAKLKRSSDDRERLIAKSAQALDTLLAAKPFWR